MPRTSSSKNVTVTTTTPSIKTTTQESSFFGTIKQGLAFGAGASIARNLVDSVMGGATPPAATPVHAKCLQQQRDYDVCMHLYMTDGSASCENQATSLIQCYKQ
jgi:hypothetical protein